MGDVIVRKRYYYGCCFYYSTVVHVTLCQTLNSERLAMFRKMHMH